MVQSIHFGSEIAGYIHKEKTGDQFDPGTEKIELTDDEGRLLGHCQLKYFTSPLPFYYISFLSKERNHIRTESETQTTGDLIMSKINTFLKGKNLPGILISTIPHSDSATSLFQRNGWRPLLPDRERWMGLNFPENLDPGTLKGMISTVEDDYHEINYS